MEFVAPLMLLGLLGAGVPIAIHLIGRQRAKVIRFAAIDFLLGSNKRVARRLRLRELLLLAARVLATVAVVLVLSKPYTSCATHGPAVQRGAQAAVLVIDNSLASTYRASGGDSLLAEAKSAAKDLLTQMGPEAEVGLVTTAEGSPSPAELARDHLRVRDSIEKIKSVPRPGDSTLALRRAAQLLEASSQKNKRIYLLSPMTAAEFSSETPPWPQGSGPPLTLVNLMPSEIDNVAAVDLAVEPDPDTGSRGVKVTATLVNYGTRAVEDRGVRLTISDAVVARGAVSILPGESVEKNFTAALPEGVRISDIEFAVDADSLTLDDRRYVRAQLREEVRTLLVNGDPRTVRHEDELFYLETALRPGDRGDSGIAVTITNGDELPDLDFDRFDVIVLVNVVALNPELVQRLGEWIDRGGGLLVSVGDRVNSDAYNKTMIPLLPQQLRDPVDLAYGATGVEERGRVLHLAKLETDHPIFAVFPQDANGLRESRFRTIALLGPTTNVSDRRVLARYSNGATALVEARRGLGRVLLFTSTLDRDWNDLAIHPGYLPFVQRAVRYLARKQDDRRDTSGILGHQHDIAIEQQATRVEIEGPGKRRTVIEGERVAGRQRVAFTETDAPGFYRVAIANEDRRAIARPDKDFAINLDPQASEMRPAAPEQLPVGGEGGGSGAPPERRVELWHALAAVLLGLLVVESLLLQR